MLTAVLLLAGTAAQAQERGANQNDLTFAVTAGYNASVMQEALPGNWSNYSIAAPSTNRQVAGDRRRARMVLRGPVARQRRRRIQLHQYTGVSLRAGFRRRRLLGNGRHPRLRRRGQPQHHAVQCLPGLRPLLPHRSRRTPSLRGNQGRIRLRSGHRLQGRRDMDGPVRGRGLQHPRGCDCRSGLLLHGGLLHRGLGGPLRLHLLLHDGQAAGRPRCPGSRQPQLQRLRRSHHQDRFLFLTKQPQSDQ